MLLFHFFYSHLNPPIVPQVISLLFLVIKVKSVNSPGNLNHINPLKFRMGVTYLEMNSEKDSCHNMIHLGYVHTVPFQQEVS